MTTDKLNYKLAHNKKYYIDSGECHKCLLLSLRAKIGQETRMYYLKVEKLARTMKQEKNVLNTKYSKLQLTHKKILKRRTREDYKCGNVIYIVSHEAFTEFYKTFYFKIGKARQKILLYLLICFLH
jgi:hypothetical protein